MVEASIFDQRVESHQSECTTLASYQGNVLLIVNVASACGFTPQYHDLVRWQQKYHQQGFSVLAFPCNQFGQQEPGTTA